LWLAGCAWGQDKLSGRVTVSNQPVPGATATATWEGGKASTTSDDEGQFELSGLPATAVQVAVSIFGFEAYHRTVGVAERAKPIEVVLKVAGIAERSPAPTQDFSQLAALESQAATSAEASMGDPSQASEAYLVQGSLSRGLEQPAQPRDLTAFGNENPETPAAGRPGRPSARRTGANTQAQSFGNRRGRSRNRIQGGVFMTLRNSVFDAAPYSLTGAAVDKPSYANTRFGGSLGGNLRIPKLLEGDPAFFFLNYTGTRSRSPYSQFAVVPDAAERAGDFSGSLKGRLLAVYDPASHLPFPGKKVPESRFDAAAQDLATLIPQPNYTAALQNYQLVTSYPSNSDNLSARLLRPVTRKDRVNVGMNWQQRDGQALQLFGYRDFSGGSGLNIDTGWSHSITSRLLSNFRASYNRNNNEALPYFAYGPDISGQLGIQGNSREPINYGPPNLNFTNFGDLTDGAYLSRRNMTWTFSEGVSYVKGRHTLQTGFEFQRIQWNSLTEQNARGTIFFGGLATSGFDSQGLAVRNTGFDYADFLLGYAQQSTVRFEGADTYMRASQYAAFVQDDWRARPGLSVNLGLRYEYFSPFQEKYGRMANLDISPDFTKVAVVTPGTPSPYSGLFPPGLIDPDRNNFSPRGAVAWRPFAGKRHLVRAGYGIYYDGSVYNRIPTRLASQPPFAQASTFQTSIGNVLTLREPFTGPPSVSVKNTYAVSRVYRTPYAQSWNLSFQYDLPAGMVMEFGYLGTKGTRLVLQRQPNTAPPGSPVNAEDRRPIDDAAGFTLDSTLGNSIFHAAQVRFSRRMRRGIAVNALYTFSKSIDNASSIGGGGSVVVQNDKDFRAERGLSSFDQRHTLTVDSVITSPFGPRGQFLLSHSLGSTLLRDWNLQISASLNSGTPYTARVLGNAADSAGTGSTGSSRADATGLLVDLGTGYFNTLAYRVPASGTFGNAGRNTIPGVGFLGLNGSFGRSFGIGDNSRRRLEFRLEAQNFVNHVNITGLSTVVNAVDFGLANRAGSMRTISLTFRYRF